MEVRFIDRFSFLDPNPDLENCHCEGSEAIPPFSVRLPRLRAVTHACTKCQREDKHFGVQARTFQVLAMTEWAKGFVL